MSWIILAIIFIAGWYFYIKRKDTVRITKDQAALFGDLVRKEAESVANQAHDLVDREALNGKTISIDAAFKYEDNFTEEQKEAFIGRKLDLKYRFGETMPVNTAHRLLKELEGKGSMWSDNPGCFERHLQRRDGNPLFPSKRRIITRIEIEEAK